MTPDDLVHAFRTPLGMPPSIDDPPACGVTLTGTYDFPDHERPVCPECAALVARCQGQGAP